ncbi:MAG: NOB1 family endonuclease [Promethearchaeota archaeon]
MIPQKNNSNLEPVIAVFDTNIFLLGIDFSVLPFKKIITSSKVIEEIKEGDKNRNIIHKVQAALESQSLFLRTPSPDTIKKIKNESKKTGDLKALSLTDVELIALMVELIQSESHKVLLFTNDFSMQNLCSELKIPFSPLIREGIKKKIIWEVYCPYCKDTFPPEYLNSICENCHSKLKRRPKR